MMMIDKVVVRYKEGGLMKGYMRGFSEKSPHIYVKEADGDSELKIAVDSLKAIFFVKSFTGRSAYREKKKYGIREKTGDRVFVKFDDGESLVGFLSGDVPWDRRKGYFLSKKDRGQKGFFLIPVDDGCNNIKVFVILSGVEDVTVMS